MDLTYFPFDVQTLRICIRPEKHALSTLRLGPHKTERVLEHHTRHEWHISGHCTQLYATDPDHSTTGKVYGCLHIVALAKREHAWYVWNIMLPNLGITLLTMGVF